MALDIHRLENGKPRERLFTISDADFALLNSSFELFSKRTGLPIDPYADLKLSSGFQALIDALNEQLKAEIRNDVKVLLQSVLRVLNNAQAKGLSIIFCGD